MIGVESAERVEALIKDAVAKGAKLAAGGQREGAIMAATVLDFVSPEMTIYRKNRLGRSPPSCARRMSKMQSASPTIPSMGFRPPSSGATSIVRSP